MATSRSHAANLVSRSKELAADVRYGAPRSTHTANGLAPPDFQTTFRDRLEELILSTDLEERYATMQNLNFVRDDKVAAVHGEDRKVATEIAGSLAGADNPHPRKTVHSESQFHFFWPVLS